MENKIRGKFFFMKHANIAGFFFFLGLTLFFFALSANPGIIYITNNMFGGELEYAYRSKISGEQIGWNIRVLSQEKLTKNELTNANYIITTVPFQFYYPNCKNYLILFAPGHHFFTEFKSLRDEYFDYDGYLITFPDTSILEEQFESLGKPFHKLQWYPSAQRTSYIKVNPQSLVCMTPNWGNRIHASQYKKLYSFLNEVGYCRFYGNDKHKKLYPKSYCGPLPYDGHSVIEKMQEGGIALVMHSDLHIEYGIPSGRIFEALASSAVIISDMNPFVVENFGDSVLYFDQSRNGKEMFKQIDSHMQWILSHPDEAVEMAKRAHEIFDQNFTLDDQFLRLLEFQEQTRPID